MIVNENNIKSFIQLQADLQKWVKNTGMTYTQIEKGTGFSRQRLARNFKNRSFTGPELLKISQYINKAIRL